MGLLIFFAETLSAFVESRISAQGIEVILITVGTPPNIISNGGFYATCVECRVHESQLMK